MDCLDTCWPVSKENKQYTEITAGSQLPFPPLGSQVLGTIFHLGLNMKGSPRTIIDVVKVCHTYCPAFEWL